MFGVLLLFIGVKRLYTVNSVKLVQSGMFCIGRNDMM